MSKGSAAIDTTHENEKQATQLIPVASMGSTTNTRESSGNFSGSLQKMSNDT